jgi:hypothetical protein
MHYFSGKEDTEGFMSIVANHVIIVSTATKFTRQTFKSFVSHRKHELLAFFFSSHELLAAIYLLIGGRYIGRVPTTYHFPLRHLRAFAAIRRR